MEIQLIAWGVGGIFAIIGFIWGVVLHNGLSVLSKEFANYKTHVAETYPSKEYMASLKQEINNINIKLDKIFETGILNRRDSK